MLWGLVALSAPILLNLLNQRRHKIVQWGAMRFLALALEKNKKKMKFENLLLLLVRMMIIFCLVMAFSEPYLKRSHTLAASLATKRQTILVLDNSYSMGARLGNITYFQKMKEVALEFIKNSEIGDAIALMAINEDGQVLSEPRVIDGENKNKKVLISMINELSLSEKSTNYGALFPLALHFLKKFKENPSLE
ncbi:MAG: VWA domain-containing protein, partial [Planctomycetota bacterium]